MVKGVLVSDVIQELISIQAPEAMDDTPLTYGADIWSWLVLFFSFYPAQPVGWLTGQ